jgi:hypothetical protein
MKSVDLLDVSLDDLGNVPPTVGAEIVLSGVRYQVLHVKPPQARSPRPRKNSAAARSDLWRVLVRTVSDAAAPPPA